MRRHGGHHGGFTIGISIAVALSLAVIPLPSGLEPWRPEWTTMTLIYWGMAIPSRIGIGISWTTGLLLDALRSGLLGQQALALAIVAFIVLKLHRRLRVFPLWQQSGMVFLLILLQQAIQLWVDGISGHAESVSRYLLPVLASTLLWPIVYFLLRHIRRSFQIH